MRLPRPKFKVSFYLYFCCFWINVTQINFENIKRKIQRIISDSCFQSKSWFNVDARAPSISLLNFPFKGMKIRLHKNWLSILAEREVPSVEIDDGMVNLGLIMMDIWVCAMNDLSHLLPPPTQPHSTPPYPTTCTCTKTSPITPSNTDTKCYQYHSR